MIKPEEGSMVSARDYLAAMDECDRLNKRLLEMLAVLAELQESASYWSEYDVPLGIVDRINDVIAKSKGATVSEHTPGPWKRNRNENPV